MQGLLPVVYIGNLNRRVYESELLEFFKGHGLFPKDITVKGMLLSTT
jgi:RNA recognition motif-containing protein